MRAGGRALILGALAFAAVFSYLAARFADPDVLVAGASDLLPRLPVTGTAGRSARAVSGFLPPVRIPAGVGAVLMTAFGIARLRAHDSGAAPPVPEPAAETVGAA